MTRSFIIRDTNTFGGPRWVKHSKDRGFWVRKRAHATRFSRQEAEVAVARGAYLSPAYPPKMVRA